MSGSDPAGRAKIRASAAEHVERYLATEGTDGYMHFQWPTLILTTTGRRSGQPRRTPLIFGEDAGRYVLVGSFGGSPRHPAWYLNLLAAREAEVQVREDRFAARARTAVGSERERLWRMMAELFPYYEGYERSAGRVLPVVVLERV
jgi:deazaflavin-dependent oxidoreductase (nitroreductase family)